jgi:purine-binding chemotaxis protein CheW
MSEYVDVDEDVVNDPVLQWVTYHLDDEVYGINVMQVQEVLKLTEIAPVPGAKDYVLGIINLRGNVVTVIDTRKRFGLMSKEQDDLSRIIVVEVGDNVVGMLVDSVAEVVYLHQSEIEASPTVSNDESSYYIQGVSNRDDTLLILIDINKFIRQEDLSNS